MTAPSLIERLLYMADGRTQPELARELMQEAALELARLTSQLEAAGLAKPAPFMFPTVDANGRCLCCGNDHGSLPCPKWSAAANPGFGDAR